MSLTLLRVRSITKVITERRDMKKIKEGTIYVSHNDKFVYFEVVNKGEIIRIEITTGVAFAISTKLLDYIDEIEKEQK